MSAASPGAPKVHASVLTRSSTVQTLELSNGRPGPPRRMTRCRRLRLLSLSWRQNSRLKNRTILLPSQPTLSPWTWTVELYLVLHPLGVMLPSTKAKHVR
eukprot:8267338-Pyramimonas_sp.AAC.1